MPFFRVGNEDDEHAFAIGRRLSCDTLLGIVGENFHILLHGVVHHPAVQRAVTAVPQLVPKSLLFLEVLDLIGGRQDHLYPLLGNKMHLFPLEGEDHSNRPRWLTLDWWFARLWHGLPPHRKERSGES